MSFKNFFYSKISKEGRGNKDSVDGSCIRVDELGNAKISKC